MLKRSFEKFWPESNLNRMGHVGDVKNARSSYKNGNNNNLKFLLQQRFSWMNDYIDTSWRGIELGAGIGASKDFIDCNSLLLSDFSNDEWLDLKNVDALNTRLQDESFDFIIASNMIHHLAFPSKFFAECHRLLKPHGIVLIQEIETSLLMRFLLRLMRHEGFDESINVFDRSIPCNDERDLWSANCSIPKLLFDDEEKFELNHPEWKIEHNVKTEFLIFLNSGGVIAKTKYVPLSNNLLNLCNRIDQKLISFSSNVFALQRQVVISRQ